MAYFKIEEPGKAEKYIKDVDTENCKLTFQNTSNGAYSRSSGIIADSMRDFIKFHYKEQHPEVKYLKVVY